MTLAALVLLAKWPFLFSEAVGRFKIFSKKGPKAALQKSFFLLPEGSVERPVDLREITPLARTGPTYFSAERPVEQDVRSLSSL